MYETDEQLERLITRFLDNEITSAEKRALDARLARDPSARSLFEEVCAFDREAGRSMRTAVQGAVVLRPATANRMQRFGRVAAGLAAACIGFFAWMSPREFSGELPGGAASSVARASWFQPLRQMSEIFSPVKPEYERPSLRLQQTDREWLMIPSDVPGQYYLIEVDRTKTRLVGLHGDF